MIIQADIRLENIWTAVDIIKRCLFQKQARTVTIIDGWVLNRQWKKKGRFCSKSRLMVVSSKRMQRLHEYEELLPRFLEAKALAFSSDFSAIEAINFFVDHKISIPDQISVTGFDDSIYASLVRPKLTTVHQDVSQKAHIALKRLMKLIQGDTLEEMNVKSPVYLVKRDSVRE